MLGKLPGQGQRRVFGILHGDPVRLQLLSQIATAESGEACVCDLTAGFDLTGPTISHHLKVLREADLIDCERRGTWVYCWIMPERVNALAHMLAAGRQTADLPAVASGRRPARCASRDEAASPEGR